MNVLNNTLVSFIRKDAVFTSIKYLALTLLFVAPFTLLYIDTSLLFPYITGKNFLWRTVIAFAFVLWLTLVFVDERYRINIQNPVLLGLGGVAGAYALALLFGIDPFRSFWSNAERMDGWIGWMGRRMDGWDGMGWDGIR